ncbi:mitochondrial ribosomal protein S5 [Xylocopa sonorina]|uniref:mitochondrial ribosomal protein S5 n=1 Tax=Xylocopa sonorina TaxID=1818115 RepID=UPI00403AFF80
MANRIFGACTAVIHSVKCISVTKNAATTDFLKPQVLLVQNTRNTNFFNKKQGTQLWKSVTSVSNAGKRRGRARGVPKMRNLNRGQKLGWGKIPILFPGFNTPIMQGNYINQQRKLTKDEQGDMPAREVAMLTKKRMKIHPLERGWSGGLLGGKKIGPPDPVDGDTFEGFESIVLSGNNVTIMTSHMGRTKYCRSMVVTGNRNGLAGFAAVTKPELKLAITSAKNRASKRLMFVERYNNHTVMHDFYTRFANTKIFVQQKPKGYGLRCHRAIRACCEVAGITDMYAKIEGSTNISNIVRAFFIGLLQQKTHEEMANEKQLHLVEVRKENYYFPTVLASPEKARSSSEIPSDEVLDFDRYVMNGRIPLRKKKKESPFAKLPSWLIHLRRYERSRGQDKVLIRARAEFGDNCSFLAAKYPEAACSKWRKHDKKIEEENV